MTPAPWALVSWHLLPRRDPRPGDTAIPKPRVLHAAYAAALAAGLALSVLVPRLNAAKVDEHLGTASVAVVLPVVHKAPAARKALPRPVEPANTPASARPGGASCTATWFSGAQGAYGPLVGMFAASRQYRGGTRLLVAHNGRSVTVTVLDYGPAAWTGHCIDLAPAAFAVLAPTSAGVIDVTVRPI